MTPAEFQKLFEQRLVRIKKYVEEELPRHIGKLAMDHYQQNFRLGGFVDDTLKPWKPSKRIGTARGAAGGYGTLLSHRARLMDSVIAYPSTRRVIVSSYTPYSRIHNEGGSISQNIPVTPKMRRFAWAKYYESGQQDGAWKGLALTRKKVISRTITMPRRQFMGRSAMLMRRIGQRSETDIMNILTNK